jgi:LSD1 subclass zinc finger protein
MEMLSMSCNKCGAPLEVPTGTNFVTCAFCKASLAIRTSGNAAYTEVLANIDRKTDEILEHVEALSKHVTKQVGTHWELCEISWRIGPKLGFLRSSLEFFAEASGPRGTYSVGVSWPVNYELQSIGQGNFIPKQTAEAEEALDALIDSLDAEHWKFYEQGQYWYQAKLRRRFK